MRTLLLVSILGSALLGAACSKTKENEAPAPPGKSDPGTMTATDARAPAPPAGKALSEADATARIQAFFGHLAKQEIGKAFAACTPEVQKALPEDKLKLIWEQLTAQAGAFKSLTVKRSETKGELRRAEVEAQFDKGPATFFVVIAADGRLAGLRIKPNEPQFPPWEPPPYAKADQLREEEVTVGEGELALPGTLTLPAARGGKTVPAVVLVHGSGPQDRDETIGPNKVFKDLAWGLAARGVAVLRYEKVTRAHGAKVVAAWGDDVTIDRETVDDALLAAALLRKRPEIAKDAIYYLGHSQGAMAGPRAGMRDPALAGLILLAGPTRPFEDVGLSQYEYIASLDGPNAEAAKPMLARYREAIKLVKDPKLDPRTPKEKLPMEIPAAFWLWLRTYDITGTAKALKMPILVLQGESDYQVTMEDLAGWKKGLAGKANATFRSYPKLGHTFIDLGVDKARPESYFTVTGHVALPVIEDIVRFIRPQSGRPLP